jgi:hypothetical protein
MFIVVYVVFYLTQTKADDQAMLTSTASNIITMRFWIDWYRIAKISPMSWVYFNAIENNN